MAATKPAVKLHDKFTGLKLLATRVPAFPKSVVQFQFEAPRPIPERLLPADLANPRASIDAFHRINDYLKSRILELD